MKNSKWIILSILLFVPISINEYKDIYLLSMVLFSCTYWIVKQMELSNETKQ